MNVIIKKLEKKIDERGFVLEILRSEQVNSLFGQIYISTVKPGRIKGNHYHKRKKEWYCVIRGSVKVHLYDMRSNERKEVLLNADNPILLQINPGICHAIENNGEEEAWVLSYISESFNPNNPDTFNYEIIKK